MPAESAMLPAPAAPSAQRQGNPAITGLAGLVVGGRHRRATWAVLAGTGDCKPATFSPTGAFALTDGVVRADDTGWKGTGAGYDDIAEGTFATVYDAAGGVATTGNLDSSKYAEGYCIFKVAVDHVPKGEKFHQVEVPHRGKLQLGGMEAEDGNLATTLAQTSPHDWVPDLMPRCPTAAAAICRAAADERMTL